MSEEKMDKFRILASRENSEAGLEWLRSLRGHGVTWSEVRDFISSYVWPRDLPDTTANEYNVYLALLLHADEMERAGQQPWDDPQLENTLRHAKSVKDSLMDGLSQVGVVVPPGGGKTIPWAMLSSAFFLAPFEENGPESGGFLTITGPPRKGKTGQACLLLEHWHREHPEAMVFANIRSKDPPSWVRYVDRMSDLLRGVADAMEADVRFVWVFDDAGLYWIKSRPTETRAIAMERLARVVPKWKGSFLYIEQRFEGIPSTIQDFSTSHILVDQIGFGLYDYPAHRIVVRSIPKSKEFLYETGAGAYFSMDIDMDKFFAVMPEKGGKTQAQRIRAFLDKVEMQKQQPHDVATGKFLPKLPPELADAKSEKKAVPP